MNYQHNGSMIFAALYNHIEANKGGLHVFYNGVPFKKPNDEAFFLVTDNRQPLIRNAYKDNCKIMHRGNIFLNAHIPVALKWSPVIQVSYANAVNNMFQDGMVIREYGLEIKIDNHPFLASNGYSDQDGTHMNYPMRVNWQCFC